MQIDTWYDLAVSELSELTDHAKEMISEAEKAAMAVQVPAARGTGRPGSAPRPGGLSFRLSSPGGERRHGPAPAALGISRPAART